MDQYELTSDPCDRRLIRLNNCLMTLYGICSIFSFFIKDYRAYLKLLFLIDDITFLCLSPCMIAQVTHEKNYQENLKAMENVCPGVGTDIELVNSDDNDSNNILKYDDNILGLGLGLDLYDDKEMEGGGVEVDDTSKNIPKIK